MCLSAISPIDTFCMDEAGSTGSLAVKAGRRSKSVRASCPQLEDRRQDAVTRCHDVEKRKLLISSDPEKQDMGRGGEVEKRLPKKSAVYWHICQ